MRLEHCSRYTAHKRAKAGGVARELCAICRRARTICGKARRGWAGSNGTTLAIQDGMHADSSDVINLQRSEWTVAALMTGRPIVLSPDERLDIALALMVSCRFRHLPVEKHGRLVGILSLRDLYSVAALRETTAESVMSRRVITVEPGDSMESALQTMLRSRVSCLPVVVDQHAAGIVTVTDFLRHALAALHADGDPPVARLMTPGPLLTVQATDTLDCARSMMRRARVRHLPVMTGERLVGLLSDHDVIAAAGRIADELPLDRDRRAGEVRVCDMMSDRVVTISPDDSAVDVGKVLLRRKLGALPVLRRGRLVGMLSVTDYFHYLLSLTGDEQHMGAAK